MQHPVNAQVLLESMNSASLDGAQYQTEARRIPLAILFSDPDVCMAGLSYGDAEKKNAIIATAEGASNGRSRVLGASMFLTKGGHLAHQIAWAIQAGQTVHDLLAMPFYHPSIEEILQALSQRSFGRSFRRLDGCRFLSEDAIRQPDVPGS